MSGAAFNIVEHHVERIRTGSGAIGGLTKLLSDFGVDDACNDEIPKEIKSEYIKGCLVEAIRIIAESNDYHIDELNGLLESKKPG